MVRNYYKTLSVASDANSATIHRAFRELARRYHPDAGIGSSTNKFRDAVEAYRVLSDPTLRRRHDFELTATAPPSRVAPEPLFATPGWQDTTSTRWSQPAPPTFDEMIAEMFAMIDAAFDSW
jgi:DnaJ-class molecular chaperone